MKRLAFLTLAVVAAAGCSSTESEETPVLPLPSTQIATPAQFRAFARLEASTEKAWLWVQHDTLKTPMHLSAPSRGGKAMLLRGESPITATLSVLTANKELFRMRDPAVELASSTTRVDELGMTHARFQQLTHGIPVSGGELTAHYDRGGHLTSIDANYVADLDGIDVQPAIPVADARAAAKADIVSKTAVEDAFLDADAGDLVVATVAGAPARLVYRFTVNALAADEPAIWVTTVDAKSGEILERYNNVQTVQGQGLGVLGDQKTFEVSADGANGFLMTDGAAGVLIRTFTAQTQQVAPGAQVASNTVTSWDTGVNGAGAAVDAHFNAAAVFKYFRDKHARNAIDGTGGALISTVHFGRNYENAAWTGNGMIYGDGATRFRALSVGLDVVAHEFTHGVTERTSRLVYQNQPGALNEAVSDIFGAFIEHTVAPDVAKNWAIGETVVRQGAALRDMRNPVAGLDPQPAHMNNYVQTQQDNGGVHINSGIINNAAWLMTTGGVNPVSKIEVKFGIGWEKSEKLWYRANTTYFQQQTNFGQAALGVLQAAKDLNFTQVETNIVDCAFKATGIVQGACAAAVDPQSTNPVPGTSGGPATGPGTGTDPGGDPAVEGEEPAPTAPKTRRQRVVTETSGCTTAGGGTDAGLVGLLVAIGLVAARRKKH